MYHWYVSVDWSIMRFWRYYVEDAQYIVVIIIIIIIITGNSA